MKVLQNNNFFKVDCPHCSSQLGVHVEDIRYNEITHHGSTFEVTCGACDKSLGISRANIPSGWIFRIIGDEAAH